MSLIPDGQLCEAFDPMMILPSKTEGIIDNPMNANTSCSAPAYVYLEGSHGKRFLCDFHYEYEKSITLDRTPQLWPKISKILIDQRRDIEKTFSKPKENNRTVFGKCWCGYDGYVRLDGTKNNSSIKEYCNFHYRKLLYRYLSNNLILQDLYDIIDDRCFMTESVIEEAEKLTEL